MKKKSKIIELLDPVIIIGALFSIGLSLILFLTGVDTITSVIVGLIGVTISLLLDLIARNKQMEEVVLETLGLNSDLYADKWAKDRLVDMIQSWKLILSSNYHPLLLQIARLRTQDARDQLVAIASGEVMTDATENRLLAVAVEEAKVSVKASSMVSLDFWNSPAGKKYLDVNYEAVKRGVNVTRVFIIDNLSPETETLMKDMAGNGVNVLIVNKEQVPGELRVAFVISDDHLVWTTEFTPDMMFREHHISIKSEDVMRTANKFEKLKWLGEKYSPDRASAG
jgi:hypothetical protein